MLRHYFEQNGSTNDGVTYILRPVLMPQLERFSLRMMATCTTSAGLFEDSFYASHAHHAQSHIHHHGNAKEGAETAEFTLM